MSSPVAVLPIVAGSPARALRPGDTYRVLRKAILQLRLVHETGKPTVRALPGHQALAARSCTLGNSVCSNGNLRCPGVLM
jgi:hypothetical protein